MKLPLTIIALLLSALPLTAQHLYVGSYNIRYINSEDDSLGNGWSSRCPVVCSQIAFEHPDILGTQEVLHPMLNDMLQRLDDYSAIGVGREDGATKGEYAAIFYDKQRLQLLDSGHFWLSETPEKPSKGWDAACERICTWGKFRCRDDGFTFCFFNLHTDHVGVVARRESAKLVMQRMTTLAGGLPTVLTGDFNVDQNDEVYSILTTDGRLKDTFTNARIRFAENGTFTAYHQDRKTNSRIDHVFVSKHFTTDRYGILTNTYWTGFGDEAVRRMPSDHYPVMVHLTY